VDAVDTSLGSAREALMELRWESKGTICPCCDQRARVYKRKLRSAQATWLLALVKESAHEEQGWVYKGVLKRQEGGDYGKLQLFGLIEAMSPEEALNYGGRTGVWRPTDLGIAFAYGRVPIPLFVHVYNGVRVADPLPVPQVFIRGLFGTAFDYDALAADLPKRTESQPSIFEEQS